MNSAAIDEITKLRDDLLPNPEAKPAVECLEGCLAALREGDTAGAIDYLADAIKTMASLGLFKTFH